MMRTYDDFAAACTEREITPEIAQAKILIDTGVSVSLAALKAHSARYGQLPPHASALFTYFFCQLSNERKTNDVG